MKIIGGRKQCNNCGALLEYNSNDIEVLCNDPRYYHNAPRYITCPCCHNQIFF